MSRVGVVAAIVRKDFKEFLRDRFYVFISIFGLVLYVAIYWILPSSVDETIDVGVHGAELGPALVLGAGEDQGLAITEFSSASELEQAVLGEGDQKVAIGLDFPPGFLSAVVAGEPATVRVLITADVPPEYRDAMSAFVKELAYAVAGDVPPITQPAQEDVILGEDRAGDQVSLQERMGPMFVFFLLLIETFALGTLVASEIQNRTVTAILATPARLSDFLAAKAVLGTLLAFSQALLLAVLIGIMGASPVVLIAALLLGSILVTGVGLIAGSTGKDFVGLVFWSMAFMIPMMVPAFAVLFPGSAAAWVRALPTYGLVETIIRASAFGDGLADVAGLLLMLAAWCVVAFGTGLVVLRRKVVAL
jgi:ABC-2 type transport system permease protein